jgi:hypothetical protein
MSTFDPRLDILSPAQRALWSGLKAIPKNGFTLYGGTALALRLGHRSSVDFDFFSDLPIDRDKLYREIPFLQQGQVLQDEGDALTLSIPSKGEFVKVSFYGNIGFGRVGFPDFTADNALEVASLIDIFGTKLKVILQRAEAKDYKDIVALLKSGQNLESGLGAAQALFGSQLQPSESLKALSYFEDGDLRTLTGEERSILSRAAAGINDIERLPIQSRTLSGDDLQIER